MDSGFHGELFTLPDTDHIIINFHRQIALTTTALALPLVLLRRQRTTTAIPSRRTSSQLAFAPPARRAPLPHVPSAVPPQPRIPSARTPPIQTSTISMPSANVETLLQGSLEPSSPTSREDSFNGVLYSLKAFSIATVLVIASGAASVWGVKAYLGIKDTQEFASAMRLTLLNKWPLLTSRIHRPSDTTRLPPPLVSPSVTAPCREWSWPAAQARLAAAYESDGVAQFAEVAIGELEAEFELERRKRGLLDPSEGQS
ncbi:hypothetical protein F5148DRAFT_982649 [Russula earlei]|uniref:Uncharacterized protein n=1 Tax=Russula earlei TaxID=71964 RepID=A0ACC0U5X3_9AGAM|nr:hypothetical protein F5148DRAFT_982649 [Russula earlei]